MVSERAEPGAGEIVSSTKTTPAPPGFWTLSQIVEWMAFGEDPALAAEYQRQHLIERAAAMLIKACGDQTLGLIGAQNDQAGDSGPIPWRTFLHPIWLFLPDNSIQADDEAAEPAFLLKFEPWLNVRGLADEVRRLWPSSAMPGSNVAAPLSRPGQRRAATARDDEAFLSWAEGEKGKNGLYPTREAVEKFASDRNLSRSWSRIKLASLPPKDRHKAGAPPRRH